MIRALSIYRKGEHIHPAIIVLYENKGGDISIGIPSTMLPSIKKVDIETSSLEEALSFKASFLYNNLPGIKRFVWCNDYNDFLPDIMQGVRRIKDTVTEINDAVATINKECGNDTSNLYNFTESVSVDVISTLYPWSCIETMKGGNNPCIKSNFVISKKVVKRLEKTVLKQFVITEVNDYNQLYWDPIFGYMIIPIDTIQLQ